MSRAELEIAHRETQRAWNQNAAVWDEHMGEGNDWHLTLVWPPTERLLALQDGERVLDVACGNGLSARRMAAAGVTVVAFDYAEEMIARAKARAGEHDDRIDYRVVDATDEAALLALGEGMFDAAVCNMALMDIADIQPLMRAVAKLLRPSGRLVFSVLHPCFNGRITQMTELTERAGKIQTVRAVKISEYLQPAAELGIALRQQAVPHYYFHRPLHLLLQPAFDEGFVLDGLAEPAFPEGHGEDNPANPWKRLSQIPPVLVGRLRLPG